MYHSYNIFHIKIFFHFFPIFYSNRFLSMKQNGIVYVYEFSTVFDVTQCEQLELLKGLRRKLQIIQNIHSMVGSCISGTWTFQTYQQLQLILLALTYTLVRVLYIVHIRLCKWLGYCKISKALISVYTINRKMGLKVCWGATFV